MTPLRAFVYYLDEAGEAGVEVARDLEALREMWSAKKQPASIAIHVGFWRPESSAFRGCLDEHVGRVLLTWPAMLVLKKVGTFSSSSIVEIDGEKIFLALTGWGYEVADPSPVSHRQTVTEAAPQRKVVARFEKSRLAWLEAFRHQYPQEFVYLREAQIVDDDSFLLKCGSLKKRTRVSAETFRLDYIVGQHPARTLSAAAFAAPKWIQDRSLAAVDVSTRSLNVFTQWGISKIADLIGSDDYQFLRLGNFGKKSLEATIDAIRDSISTLVPSADAYQSTGQGAETQEAHATGPFDEQPLVEENQAAPSFVLAIQHLLAGLKGQKVEVLTKRMGLNRAPMTLNKIADEIGVTPQRIRQIESSAVREITDEQRWITVFRERVSNAIEGRETPLPIEGLAVIDPWFEGVVESRSVFEFALDRFLPGEFSVLEIDKLVAVTRLTAQSWLSTLDAATTLVKGSVARGWRKSDIERAVAGLLVGEGEELRQELFRCATKHAIFVDDGSGDPLLSEFGRSAEAAVKAILEESDVPLHYTEIAKRVQEKFGRTLDVRRAANAATDVAHLFGRGTFGLRKHLDLSDDALESITSAAEDIIDEGPEGRQWYAGELCDVIRERGLVDCSRLNHYGLTLALRQSKTLKYLGRFTWIKSSDSSLGTADRIEISQAAEALLVTEGRAMTRSEIKERIKVSRGIGKTFQLHEVGRLVRVGPSTWGLVDRDVPLSRTQIDALIGSIKARALVTNKGVHLAEVPGLLADRPGFDKAALDETLIASLATRSGDLNVSAGGYLHPVAWEGPRRMTPVEAVAAVLNIAGPLGIGFQDAVHRVAAKLEREVSDVYVRGLLAGNGRWDPLTRRWSANKSDFDAASDAA